MWLAEPPAGLGNVQFSVTCSVCKHLGMQSFLWDIDTTSVAKAEMRLACSILWGSAKTSNKKEREMQTRRNSKGEQI